MHSLGLSWTFVRQYASAFKREVTQFPWCDNDVLISRRLRMMNSQFRPVRVLKTLVKFCSVIVSMLSLSSGSPVSFAERDNLGTPSQKLSEIVRIDSLISTPPSSDILFGSERISFRFKARLGRIKIQSSWKCSGKWIWSVKIKSSSVSIELKALKKTRKRINDAPLKNNRDSQLTI